MCALKECIGWTVRRFWGRRLGVGKFIIGQVAELINAVSMFHFHDYCGMGRNPSETN